LTSACALFVIGCSSGERPRAEPAPAAPPATATATAPSAPPPAEPAPAELQPSSDELPIEEDFEAEAEQQISADNLHAELDAIEKELQAVK
jgi:hypothetical protein